MADDNDLVLELIGAALSHLGHRVAFASDGAQAMAALAREEFDVVITDVVMPFRSGLEVIDELVKRGTKARVIAMTGDGRGSKIGYLERAKALGAHAALAKPFTISQLVATVTSLLGPPPTSTTY